MKRVFLTSLIIFTFYNFMYTTSHSLAQDVHNVAIIIDDFGGPVKGVDSFLSGDIPITVAIMPFLEQSTEQAELAHSVGLEVMIHLPMEPKKGKTSWLGEKAITSNLSKKEIRKRVNDAIDNVPYAKGINNHMGSKIVEDEQIMRTILEVVKEHGLYIIDSGTSPKSLIPTLAEEMNIPYASRDLFLDDTHSSHKHVSKQMVKLLAIAQKKKTAIAIGHVGIEGDETYKGISESLPLLKEKEINIVPMSHLIHTNIDDDHERFWHPVEEEHS
ncbi:divergent polysaccharide deacetylase family protein [Halalkalibacter sp. APA_J-10(15)]|uniref:divergent polysaccharide deacetylase family protein n=1 Tax=unclassified Halalkalibacter TaxID=2893063 RepID=UPI001FF621BA|nr:divergent polysaccharide deacetylase family protein [Halalkalibacter sp. APA_J-10(15)]MCK0471458.1 divergent polysaccharide deacetylase family protein [Halalkalibacter sp. APA_J-10(15)]